MRLADLQGAYRHYLLTGDSAQLAPAIVADAFDGAERLGIYRNNFLVGLSEALKANFPVTLHLLGRDFFEQAARRFVLARPPRRPCLFEYGAEFPGYLSDLPELGALPYVSEVARFEFARIASYNAAVERYVSPDTLANLPPDQLEALPIRRAQHAQVVPVKAPVAELWKAHQVPDPDLSVIDMTARPQVLLVCRPDRALVVRELDAPAAQFLAAVQDETQLGAAAAQCGAEDDMALGRIIALVLELRLLVSARA
ncbi:HvfC/BufC family peptide modification chaperone [Dongia deserti]|uniref:HvfC/BufC family peptide modification chaperone n=1 Tax=Dongia deserti TaxID=2268030 RepID=UPI0013C43BA7|nr:putative DNA-binding domain-containing protein [Dongia deserti]